MKRKRLEREARLKAAKAAKTKIKKVELPKGKDPDFEANLDAMFEETETAQMPKVPQDKDSGDLWQSSRHYICRVFKFLLFVFSVWSHGALMPRDIPMPL